MTKTRQDWSAWLQAKHEELEADSRRFFPATIKARRRALLQLAQTVGQELVDHDGQTRASALRPSWDKLVRPFTMDETGCPITLADWKVRILEVLEQASG